MTNKKIKLKIGRKVYNIGANDILMDNGVLVQLTTQNGPFRDWTYTAPVLSKKLFKDLKSCCFIFEDQELTKKYSNLKLVYYRFNIFYMQNNDIKYAGAGTWEKVDYTKALPITNIGLNTDITFEDLMIQIEKLIRKNKTKE